LAGSVRDPWATTARARRARRRRARSVAGASAPGPSTATGSGSPASAGASATTSEGTPRAPRASARSTAKVSAPRRRAAVTTWSTGPSASPARDLTPCDIATCFRGRFPGPQPQARVWRALTSLPRARAEHEMGQEDGRSEEHTSELQSRENLVCRLLLEKQNITARRRQPKQE